MIKLIMSCCMSDIIKYRVPYHFRHGCGAVSLTRNHTSIGVVASSSGDIGLEPHSSGAGL